MTDHYDSVVLSGGGSKGLCQLGLLHRYVESGKLVLEKINVYAGTSIGSMIALLLVCGYTPMEIFQEIHSIKSFFNVNDNQGFWEIFRNFGLASIDTFSKHIENMVARKFEGYIPTLEELYEKTGKLLLIVVTNVTKMRKEVFSHISSPRLKCTDAMKMSCNLPLLFTRIRYRGCYYVDGGLVCNVALNEIPGTCKRTLCLVTMGTDATSKDMSFMNYLFRLVILPINQITHLNCQRRPHLDTTMIVMTFNNVPILDLTMDDDAKMNMFMLGYTRAEMELNKVKLYVEGWNDNYPASTDGWDHETEWSNDVEYEIQ